MNILETITERTRERIAEEKKRVPLTEVRRAAEERMQAEVQQREAEEQVQAETRQQSAAGDGSGTAGEPRGVDPVHAGAQMPAFERALRADGLSFICEAKKASPSKGLIAEHFPYVEIARDYEAGGAAAISCLTEPYWFRGSDDYLREIVQAVSIPVLRKDFTCDEYMIYQAKAMGAGAVLLICSVLDDKELEAWHQLTGELHMSALVETHDEKEIERARRIGAKIIGVNNRNLKDFTVDIRRSIELRELAGRENVFVSESGIRGPQDMKALYENGTDAVLIGEMLMRAPDRKAALEELRNL